MIGKNARYGIKDTRVSEEPFSVTLMKSDLSVIRITCYCGTRMAFLKMREKGLCLNPHTIFLNALFGLRHVMPTPPPLWHPLWYDNSLEGNTTPSHSAGAVSGGQALSPPIIGDSQFVEILGFQKSRKNVSDAPRASAIAPYPS